MKINNGDWKDIYGYEGLYKINSNGTIYNCKTKKCLKPTYSKRIYLVCLYKNNKTKKYSLARLIAEHFVENPYNYKHIYFIDGNNKHVYASNIQWNNSNKNTKIVVDGIVFNSLTEYKKFCVNSKKLNRLMDLDNICEFDINANQNKKHINAEFKI